MRAIQDKSRGGYRSGNCLNPAANVAFNHDGRGWRAGGNSSRCSKLLHLKSRAYDAKDCSELPRRIYRRALLGIFRFAVNELLLLLFIVFSFAALSGTNSETEAICLKEHPERSADPFGIACYNQPSIRVLYALAAVLVLSALVYSLMSFLNKPSNSVDDAYASVFDSFPTGLKVFLKFAASVSCCVLLLVSALFFFAALAAWADAQHVCPFGNQCSDAQAIMWFGSTIGVLALGLFLVLLRFLLKRRQSR